MSISIPITAAGYRILQLEDWIRKQTLEPVCIAAWVDRLVPGWNEDLNDFYVTLFGEEVTRRDLWRAAMFVGTNYGDKVKLAQVSCYREDYVRAVNVPIRTIKEAEILEAFRKKLWLTSQPDTIRTAIYLGLQLPRVHLGVMSPTRTEPLSQQELEDLWRTFRCEFKGSPRSSQLNRKHEYRRPNKCRAKRRTAAW